eukprot:CAMPEP_0119123288 /NCGR_PEP_ID=MMETSP1310-20130426/3278_1 /TAXON_ID=464262 /ORGANISM="Genus nov. species nov., Strain RCC2339" /LENGTH=466 /DNA_ID=CAMNT_0007113073 /DNA_START=85 /DNA_END=1485 /DNA_ORIENTATION=+
MPDSRKSKTTNADEETTLASSSAADTEVFAPTDEFGGPIGNVGFILFSHFIVYYLWFCVNYNGGQLSFPTSLEAILPWAENLVHHITEHASPTLYAVVLYCGFMGFQVLLALTMPGFESRGMPVPAEGNKALLYHCNGVCSWYFSLATWAFVEYMGYFSLVDVVDNLGPLLTVSVIFADVVAVTAYVSAIVTGNAHRMSGNVVYDFFMGAWLNPRIGDFDLKFFGETRFPWIGLFFLTLSCAVKQYSDLGYVSFNLCFMLLAHGLYTNAVMKGEELIPQTWDIFYEKWGFMLIYWNLAGVPFVYSTTSFYLQQTGPVEFQWYCKVSFVAWFLFVYWVWDTANSQKTRFRQQLSGTFKARTTFPQLPWGTLHPPVKYLKTESGSTLLIDGWYAYARKIHYTADSMMAWSWGLCTGFNAFIPYFYGTFFTSMIIHRYIRDDHRCGLKYGADWKKYCEIVPYVFIPYVY